MNGPIKMYAMRPIVQHGVPVELPTCMYQLNNIHSDDADCKSKNGTATVSPNYNRLEATSVELLISEQNNCGFEVMGTVQQRQGVILQQLEELRKQMTSIRNTLKKNIGCATAACKTTCSVPLKSKQSIKNQIILKNLPLEITLNANPNNPPYSLLLLQNHWRHVLNINIQIYTHSSVQVLPETTQQFVQITKSVEGTTDNNLPTITVRLIWKLIGVNQLELSGSRPIQGEANLLRYLARITSSLNYDENDNEMDSLLDVSFNISRSKSKTERAPLLQRLHKKLGKSRFIFNDFSIVDIAAYSAIRQNVGVSEINVGLTKWMKNCEAL